VPPPKVARELAGPKALPSRPARGSPLRRRVPPRVPRPSAEARWYRGSAPFALVVEGAVLFNHEWHEWGE